MARLTKIYTRTGDDGTTGLGGGTRVRKDHLQVAAYGDVDETNSAIGVAIATGLGSEVSELLSRVQNELFNVGGVLCLLGEPVERKPLIEARHIAALEQACDRFNASLSPLANFVLPGGSPQAAALHLARTVCRRAERTVVALAQIREVPSELIRYLNRCSDLLFILARYENSQRAAPDRLWDTSV